MVGQFIARSYGFFSGKTENGEKAHREAGKSFRRKDYCIGAQVYGGAVVGEFLPYGVALEKPQIRRRSDEKGGSEEPGARGREAKGADTRDESRRKPIPRGQTNG